MNRVIRSDHLHRIGGRLWAQGCGAGRAGLEWKKGAPQQLGRHTGRPWSSPWAGRAWMRT